MEYTTEIWRPIVGWEGLYEVSSFGRVKSVDRIIVGQNGIEQKRKGVILTEAMNNSGYLTVHLRGRGRDLRVLVHRLVAFAFIPNPFGYGYVNHRDEDRLNNLVDNLEWCTAAYNSNYGSGKHKLSESHTNHPGLSKKVVMADKQGNILQSFASIHEASRQTEVSDSQICRCCRGAEYYRSAGGYRWYYA